MLTILSLVGGLVILTLGADWLVKGASRLALNLGVSALVVGLTVVAFGTSAPEMTVSVISALNGQPDLALGNVVGSNIFNVLFILGVSAMITPLLVNRQLIRLDVPLMILASLLLWFFASDMNITKLESLLLFVSLVAYTAFLIIQSKKEKKLSEKSLKSELDVGTVDFKDKSFKNSNLFQVFLVAVGLGALVSGSKLFVDAAVSIARDLGVSELIIGLTIVAAGTSLPEVATSIMAAIRGERDIAVGNVVGSNLFNILGVVGLSGLVAPESLPVSEVAYGFDLPVMVAVAIACLPIFFTGYVIKKWEGIVFFFYYLLYTAFLIMSAAQHPELVTLKTASLYFVLPLTLLTLVVSLFRSFKKKTAI